MTSNGILDATYHPKFDNASMQTLANMNADVQLLVALPGDNLPIPDTAPRLMHNYADAPTKLETSLWISNYGAAAIEDATLTWSLTGSAVNGSTVHVCDRTLALNGSIAQGPTSLVAIDPAISCALPDLGETPVAPPGPPPLPPRPMPSGPGWIGPVLRTYGDSDCPNVGCHGPWPGSGDLQKCESLCNAQKGCNAMNYNGGGCCLRSRHRAQPPEWITVRPHSRWWCATTH